MSIYIKICGLNTVESVDAALEAGADGIGIVLSASPRRVELALADQLISRIPPGVERIAVMDRPDPRCARILLALPWDGVQVQHTFRGHLPSELDAKQCFLLATFHDGADLLKQVPASPTEVECGSPRGSLRGCFVLDGPRGGGMGVVPDASRARQAAALGRMVLAGGLTPSSVASAIAKIRPFAVDVSSGVESKRGVKDPGRIHAFVQAARAAATQLCQRVPQQS